MSGIIIDGRELAKQTRIKLKRRVVALEAQVGRSPGLSVILVGNNPASAFYVRNKERYSKRVNIRSEVVRMPDTTTREQLLAEVDRLNNDDTVDGILVQLPIPKHIDELEVIEAIDPQKDVDGFHLINTGALTVGRPIFESCTPKGIIRMIKSTGIDISGKKAVVLGRSNIVGKPVALMLLHENATITICHSRTRDLKSEIQQADILVAAVGIPKFVTGDMIKPGAVVIDVGINDTEDGGMVGDVDFESAKEVAGYITPVPGGVGPMTIAMLLENTVISYEKKFKK